MEIEGFPLDSKTLLEIGETFKNKLEILNRKDVSAHNSVAKMGVIKILKWLM